MALSRCRLDSNQIATDLLGKQQRQHWQQRCRLGQLRWQLRCRKQQWSSGHCWALRQERWQHWHLPGLRWLQGTQQPCLPSQSLPPQQLHATAHSISNSLVHLIGQMRNAARRWQSCLHSQAQPLQQLHGTSSRNENFFASTCADSCLRRWARGKQGAGAFALIRLGHVRQFTVASSSTCSILQHSKAAIALCLV